MRKPVSALRVLPFITEYNLNVDEFAKSAFAYTTFNEFFYRALKPEARPISAGARVAVCCHSRQTWRRYRSGLITSPLECMKTAPIWWIGLRPKC